MMSPTPIQCWNSSGGMIDRICTPPPVCAARIAANRIAFRHSRLSSSTTRNLRISGPPVGRSLALTRGTGNRHHSGCDAAQSQYISRTRRVTGPTW